MHLIFFFIIDNFIMADTCSVVNLSHQIYILRSINVTESWGKWAGPYVCLDLSSVLVDNGLAVDHNFSLNVLSFCQTKSNVIG